ncbi:MAG: hypothetical protein ABEJ08_02580 [Halobacteriaceae archaeon]
MRGLKGSVRILRVAFSLLVTVAVVEIGGLYLYLQTRHQRAVERTLAGGVTLTEVFGFVTGHLDLLLVAVALVPLGVIAWAVSDSGGAGRTGGGNSDGGDWGDGFGEDGGGGSDGGGGGSE